MVGTGKGAENGILIKSGDALETAHEIDTVILDKTGTITEGKPEVTDVIPLNGFSQEELERIAVSIEKPSEHPLAEAIVTYGDARHIEAQPLSGFQAVGGRGIRAAVGDTALPRRQYRVYGGKRHRFLFRRGNTQPSGG